MPRWKPQRIPAKTVMQYMKQNRIKTCVKSVPVAVKIITEYMQMVMAAVMDGQAVNLPNKFGTLYIKKVPAPVIRKVVITNKEGKAERVGIPSFNRMGYAYRFTLEGNQFLESYGMRMEVDKKNYRIPLSEILINTDKDYRTNLLRDK